MPKLKPSVSLQNGPSTHLMDVRFPYESFAYREAIKELAGVRWEPKRKAWEVSRDLLKDVCSLAVTHELGVIDKLTYELNVPPAELTEPNPLLYSYQQQSVIKAINQRALMLNYETGLGKTPAAIDVLRIAKPKRTLIVCPAMVRLVWVDELKKWWLRATPKNGVIETGKDIALIAKWRDELEPFIAIVSYNLLTNDAFPIGMWDAIIFDECFPAGTLVATPQGKRRIETLQIGDEVFSYDPETRQPSVQIVERVGGREVLDLLDIVLLGQCIKVTPNHPFLTPDGWVEAGSLRAGTSVVCVVPETAREEELAPVLLSELCSTGTATRSKSADQLHPALALLRDEESSFIQAYERSESYARLADAGQSFSDASCYEAQAKNTRRQRPGTSKTPSEISGSFGVADRSCSQPREETQRLPDSLQAGHSQLSDNGGRGGGWHFTQRNSEKTAGQEERETPNKVRLARVESIKRRSLKPNDADSRVYNLQVSGPHTYVVGGGAVVHNSHYVKEPDSARSKAALRLVTQNLHAIKLLLTATPITSEPKDLWHQLHILYPGRFGSKWQFYKRYCRTEENQYGGMEVWGVNDQLVDELKARIAPVSVRVTKKEVAHLLPPYSVQMVRVQSTDRLKMRELVEEFQGADLHNQSLDSFLSKAGPLKIPLACSAVRESLDEGSTHMMVLTHFKESAKAIYEELSDLKDTAVYHYDGTVTASERNRITKEAANAKRAVIVSTMHAVKEGIDLTKFTDSIAAELYWQPATIIQLLGRYHRLSSRVAARFRFLVLAGSLDEIIAKVLKRRITDMGKVVEHGVSEEKFQEAFGAKRSEAEILKELRAASEKRVAFDEYA